MAVAVANCLPGLQWEEACRQRRLLKIVARSLQTVDCRVQTVECRPSKTRLQLEDWVACLTQMPRIVLKAVWPHCDLWSKAALTWANKKCVSFFDFLFPLLIMKLSVFLCRLLPVTALIAF